MNSQALVLGAGGHARAICSALHALSIKIVGCFDSTYKNGQIEYIKYTNLIGDENRIYDYAKETYEVYVAVGDNAKRKYAVEQLLSKNYSLPKLLHPECRVEKDCVIGRASVICLGALIASEVVIGDGVIINTGSVVDHESVIGDYSHIAPRVVLAGRVKVGDEVFIGMGACIAQGIKIGSKSIIGAGSIILKDVPEGSKVVGIYH